MSNFNKVAISLAILAGVAGVILYPVWAVSHRSDLNAVIRGLDMLPMAHTTIRNEEGSTVETDEAGRFRVPKGGKPYAIPGYSVTVIHRTGSEPLFNYSPTVDYVFDASRYLELKGTAPVFELTAAGLEKPILIDTADEGPVEVSGLPASLAFTRESARSLKNGPWEILGVDRVVEGDKVHIFLRVAYKGVMDPNPLELRGPQFQIHPTSHP